MFILFLKIILGLFSVAIVTFMLWILFEYKKFLKSPKINELTLLNKMGITVACIGVLMALSIIGFVCIWSLFYVKLCV